MKPNGIASQINRYRAASLLIHMSLLVGTGLLLRYLATVRPSVSPKQHETARRVVLSLPGSVESGSPKDKGRSAAKAKDDALAHLLPKPPRQGQLSQTPTTGEGAAGHSAWGKGQITIAYTKFFPYPAPDLSTMPAGTEGDVVLTALIDDQGKISDLTLLTGIDPAINRDVIQTVRSWTFTPATKDGLPVSSRQEIHFHFRSPRDG